jgi:hypothetical protein
LFVACGDGGQDTCQIAMRLNPVEFTGFDQGRDDGPVLCASIMSSEERVFAVERYGTDGAFNGVVIEFDAAVRGGPVFSASFMPRSALEWVSYHAASFMFGLRLA